MDLHGPAFACPGPRRGNQVVTIRVSLEYPVPHTRQILNQPGTLTVPRRGSRTRPIPSRVGHGRSTVLPPSSHSPRSRPPSTPQPRLLETRCSRCGTERPDAASKRESDGLLSLGRNSTGCGTRSPG